MPTFCRHNRLIQNCSICAREQNVAMRPVVTSSAPKVTQPREPSQPGNSQPRPARNAGRGAAGTAGSRPGPRGGGLKVRRMTRGAEDGFTSLLVPGLRSSEDAERLAEELVFASQRLAAMALVAAGSDVPDADPVWTAIAAGDGLEQRTTLAFATVVSGARGAGDDARVIAVTAAYEAWVSRAGSQGAALVGEASWTPERRFERIFERLGALSGMARDTRFELLTLLGGLGLYDLRAGRLFPAGENEVTWAAKRALGIGDPLLLERRAAELALACDVPLGALDLGLHNWGSGDRIGAGLAVDVELDADALAVARDALGL